MKNDSSLDLWPLDDVGMFVCFGFTSGSFFFINTAKTHVHGSKFLQCNLRGSYIQFQGEKAKDEGYVYLIPEVYLQHVRSAAERHRLSKVCDNPDRKSPLPSPLHAMESVDSNLAPGHVNTGSLPSPLHAMQSADSDLAPGHVNTGFTAQNPVYRHNPMYPIYPQPSFSHIHQSSVLFPPNYNCGPFVTNAYRPPHPFGIPMHPMYGLMAPRHPLWYVSKIDNMIYFATVIKAVPRILPMASSLW